MDILRTTLEVVGFAAFWLLVGCFVGIKMCRANGPAPENQNRKVCKLPPSPAMFEVRDALDEVAEALRVLQRPMWTRSQVLNAIESAERVLLHAKKPLISGRGEKWT